MKYLKEESCKKLKTATNKIFTRVTKISTLAEILNHNYKRTTYFDSTIPFYFLLSTYNRTIVKVSMIKIRLITTHKLVWRRCVD